MLCPKCDGILNVIKVHEPDSLEPRLCDVECLKCGEILYYQPYDWGKSFNIVLNDNNEDV